MTGREKEAVFQRFQQGAEREAAKRAPWKTMREIEELLGLKDQSFDPGTVSRCDLLNYISALLTVIESLMAENVKLLAELEEAKKNADSSTNSGKGKRTKEPESAEEIKKKIDRNRKRFEKLQASLVAAQESLKEADTESAESEEKLRAENEELKEKMEEATFQAKMDSSTSSKPPRTNGYKGSPKRGSSNEEEVEAETAALHDSNKSCAETSGKPRGKPAGSAGGGRGLPGSAVVMPEIYCEPAQCAKCSHHDECMARSKVTGKRRNVMDIEIRLVLQPYRLRSCTCPLQDDKELTGSYPADVNSSVNFGNTIRALAVTMNAYGMTSYERIAEMLTGLVGESISGPSVMNWVELASGKLTEALALIKEVLLNSYYAHCDETGVGINGKLHWIHSFCNLDFTYLAVDKKRGSEGMLNADILNHYIGIIIHDCWASYWKIENVRHGLCNAHLLRELNALVKFFAKDKEWAQEMKDLLSEMIEERDKLKKAGKKAFDPDVLADYKERYDAIIEKGMALHPLIPKEIGKRGKAKRGKARCLLDRMKEHKSEFLLFMDDFEIPATNNIAEQSIRMTAVKRSVVGCFRTEQGARDFARIWSYLSTAHKHDQNCFDAILNCLEGNAVGFLFEKSEVEALKQCQKKRLEQENQAESSNEIDQCENNAA